jgi:predicted O-linked N-acetylglucosamine transferase (SPINDLY family)
LGEHSVEQELRKQFQQLGIDPQRVETLGRVSDTSGHLAAYGMVDIALDTFPYHGTTTTCEALWMGVPVVTLAGKTHVSRVGVSILTHLGHPEWIAASPEQYVKIATDLANDRANLSHLRATLRNRMQSSPLMDATSFARDMEDAYRNMWRTWCEK